MDALLDDPPPAGGGPRGGINDNGISDASASPPVAARTEKELIAASREYLAEDKLKSWSLFLTTLLVFSLLLALTARATTWPVKLAGSVLAGLTIVRLFIFFHDYLHNAIFRGSNVAKAFFWVFGLYVMATSKAWRESHNYHHQHTAKIIGSHVGSYAMVSVGIWKSMSPAQQRMYKIVRHPLTILAGYVTIFMYGMCLSPFLRAPKKHWDSALALGLNLAASALILATVGFEAWFFVFFLPLAVAMASGAYLFYAQHNFPDVTVQGRHEWTYGKAALESSSYMKTGAIMSWFTGNIGYHHVHHLNSMIPFYRLPEAMAGIPELHDPGTTSLSPKAIAACFRLKLWDPERGEMVGYPKAD